MFQGNFQDMKSWSSGSEQFDYNKGFITFIEDGTCFLIL